MALDPMTEKAAGLFDSPAKMGTSQVVVAGKTTKLELLTQRSNIQQVIDPMKDTMDETTGDEKINKLSDRIQELEKLIKELTTEKSAYPISRHTNCTLTSDGCRDAKDARKKEAEKEAKSKDSFGSLPKFCLALYDAMKLTYDAVAKSEKLSSCAIVAFYDVAPSVVNNLEAWEEGSLVPGYLPSRVSINSKRILELLKTITDTTMNEAPCM